MLEITKNPREFYIKIQIIGILAFVIVHLYLIYLGIWAPPSGILPKISLYASPFFILIFSYFTFFKKIFPQRIGDIIQSSILIFIISVFSISYGEKLGGSFVFLYFLLIISSILLMDEFIPIFIGIIVSLLLIGEFLLINDLFQLSYLIIFDVILQVMSAIVVGFISSNFVKRIITEQKITKELQVAYEELKELDKAKTEFISIASHQLRTPLSAIKGYISMLQEKTYGVLPKKMEKPLENVYLSNERLIKLVNNLLSVSRIETGKIQIKLENSSLEEIILSLVEELKGIAQVKNIYLKYEKSEEKLPKISLDREKIRQVILNLIDNAIKYTTKGGITIKTKIQDQKCKIEIKDTGEGMTKKEISHLFRSFDRGSAGQRLWREGAGLGLYIARKFVEMHQGQIWVESKGKGRGSTFYIELPLNKE